MIYTIVCIQSRLFCADKMGSIMLYFALLLIPGIVFCSSQSTTEEKSFKAIINLLLNERDIGIGDSADKESRNDGRCGVGYLLASGAAAKCPADGDGKRPCCNLLGHCGKKVEDCKCEGCVDYSLEKNIDDRQYGTLLHEKRSLLAAVAIGAAVVAGTTLAGVTLAALLGKLNSRAVAIEVDNWTRWPLTRAWAHRDRGQIMTPPVTIKPGYKEAMTAEKSWGFFGTRGVASWQVGDTSYYMTVMWSVPYNRFFYTNWLAIGITRNGKMARSNNLFSHMRKGAGNFKRQAYKASKGIPTIEYTKGDLVIQGIMGTTGKADVKIIIKPRYSDDLAPALNKALRTYCYGHSMSVGRNVGCAYGS